MGVNLRKNVPYPELNYGWYQKTLDISAISLHRIVHHALEASTPADGASMTASLPLYYSIERDGTLYERPDSKFYKGLLLNYPSAEDAKREIGSDLITEEEYDAIMEAEETIRVPPMNTLLGGFIEIYGNGTGGGINWTEGCMAVTDRMIDRLWEMVHVGTPVLVE